MTNITALLLVLTLTGGPVGSIVCVVECQHALDAASDCHGDMATSDGPMMSASDGCRDPCVATPYVIEHRAFPDAAVPTTTSLPTTLEGVDRGAPPVLARAADAWLKPPLVLRL